MIMSHLKTLIDLWVISNSNDMASTNFVSTPTPSFNFFVGIDLFQADTMFSEVRGISFEMDVEPYLEGGNNNTIYHLPKGRKDSKLILVRGMSPLGSAFSNWCIQSTNYNLPVVPRVLTIMLMGPIPNGEATASATPLHTWIFYNAYPVKWEISEFVAEKSAYAFETIEFVYSSVSAVV